MHLTLRFIGEVDGAMARDIDDVLYQTANPCFNLSLCGTGFFNERGLPRVLWAGVGDDTELRRLHKKIQHGLKAVGLEPEHRRFHPHVTLARLNGAPLIEAEGYTARYREDNSPLFTVDRFCLVSSHLSREGAIYTIEAEYPLDSGVSYEA